MIRHAFALTALALAAGLGACTGEGAPEPVDSAEGDLSPIDRLIAGRSADYPADPAMAASLPRLLESQAARRSAAWAIAKKVLSPVTIDAGGSPHAMSVPLFQTWYAKEEILPMFDRLVRGLSPADLLARRPPTKAAIDEAFTWEAGRVTSMDDWSEERLARRRAELEALGASSLGRPDDRVLMSPALVGHLYAHYDSILGCIGAFPGPNAAPPSDTNFAPCVGEEFPAGAAIVKASWVPENLPLDAFDTSAEALTSTLTAGEWGPAPRTARPDESKIYTMRLPSGLRLRLVALHVITKELRDWTWTTLFWSDHPDTDFGADRPADLSGPFANYKMCTVVDYDEADTTGAGLPDSLQQALAATRAFGPRTWCSNPYLEQGAGNAKTNCIGCHQHAGTNRTTETILGGPDAFPDGSRAKSRTNFPADYTFVTSTGLALGAQMKAKVGSLTPH